MAAALAQAIAPTLRLDRHVVPDVRMRLWEYRSNRFLPTPAGAHPWVEIAWIDSGSASYRMGRRDIEVSAGSMVIVPAGVEHATGFGGGLSGGAIHVDAELFASAADAMGSSKKQAFEPGLVAPSDRLRRLVALLVGEAEDPEAGSTLVARGLADAIAVETLRRAPESAVSEGASSTEGRRTPRDPRVKRAVAEIEASLSEPLSVDDLARAAGMSRFHFSRLFREETGESPYRYVLLARLGRAVTLLRTGRHGVTEAALAAGFTDLGRFCRLFRERFGKSPSAFIASRGRAQVH